MRHLLRDILQGNVLHQGEAREGFDERCGHGTRDVEQQAVILGMHDEMPDELSSSGAHRGRRCAEAGDHFDILSQHSLQETHPVPPGHPD